LGISDGFVVNNGTNLFKEKGEKTCGRDVANLLPFCFQKIALDGSNSLLAGF
jgi:hypothetical protein